MRINSKLASLDQFEVENEKIKLLWKNVNFHSFQVQNISEPLILRLDAGENDFKFFQKTNQNFIFPNFSNDFETL